MIKSTDLTIFFIMYIKGTGSNKKNKIVGQVVFSYI
jgi:hypothetical protein